MPSPGPGRVEELADLDRFVDGWIERLRLRSGDSVRVEDWALLVEAAAWRDGPAGVGALARDHGPDVPELFVDWVDALVAAGERSDAAAACARALDALPPAASRGHRSPSGSLR